MENSELTQHSNGHAADRQEESNTERHDRVSV